MCVWASGWRLWLRVDPCGRHCQVPRARCAHAPSPFPLTRGFVMVRAGCWAGRLVRVSVLYCTVLEIKYCIVLYWWFERKHSHLRGEAKNHLDRSHFSVVTRTIRTLVWPRGRRAASSAASLAMVPKSADFPRVKDLFA